MNPRTTEKIQEGRINAFCELAKAGDMEGMRSILNLDKSVSKEMLSNGLVSAAGVGQSKSVEFCIALGADVNARVFTSPMPSPEDGGSKIEYMTAIKSAKEGNHTNVVELLTVFGAKDVQSPLIPIRRNAQKPTKRVRV